MSLSMLSPRNNLIKHQAWNSNAQAQIQGAETAPAKSENSLDSVGDRANDKVGDNVELSSPVVDNEGYFPPPNAAANARIRAERADKAKEAAKPKRKSKLKRLAAIALGAAATAGFVAASIAAPEGFAGLVMMGGMAMVGAGMNGAGVDPEFTVLGGIGLGLSCLPAVWIGSAAAAAGPAAIGAMVAGGAALGGAAVRGVQRLVDRSDNKNQPTPQEKIQSEAAKIEWNIAS